VACLGHGLTQLVCGADHQAFQLIREVCADLFLGEYAQEAACAKFAKYRDAKDKVMASAVFVWWIWMAGMLCRHIVCITVRFKRVTS
jgi:hypothetical protein